MGVETPEKYYNWNESLQAFANIHEFCIAGCIQQKTNMYEPSRTFY